MARWDWPRNSSPEIPASGVSSRGLFPSSYCPAYRLRSLTCDPYSRHPSENLFGIQIAGSRPQVMVPTAELLAKVCPDLDFLDVNCGCPLDLVFNKVWLSVTPPPGLSEALCLTQSSFWQTSRVPDLLYWITRPSSASPSSACRKSWERSP